MTQNNFENKQKKWLTSVNFKIPFKILANFLQSLCHKQTKRSITTVCILGYLPGQQPQSACDAGVTHMTSWSNAKVNSVMFVLGSLGTLCPICICVQFVAYISVVCDYLPSGLNGMNFEYLIRYQVHKHTQTGIQIYAHTNTVPDPGGKVENITENQEELKP